MGWVGLGLGCVGCNCWPYAWIGMFPVSNERCDCGLAGFEEVVLGYSMYGYVYIRTDITVFSVYNFGTVTGVRTLS